MIRKLLVYENALANTHPALERALQLARNNQVKLKIVDVVEGPSDVLRELHRAMRGFVEQVRKDRLDAMCEPLHDQDIEFTTELIRGRPFVEIMREVVHEGFDLVIKTAAGAQPTEGMGMMGPVDMRLVRNCPCPIWFEVPGRSVRCERVLVAVDPQSKDDVLNIVLLEVGASLVKASHGELHVVAAWEVPDEDFLAENMQPGKFEQYAKYLKSSAQDRLEALLARAGTPAGANSVHFKKGNAAKTIVDSVESQQPDVVVIGTVGHTNIRGLLIGNTADRVLRQIDRSILTVKTDSLFRA